MKVDILRLGHRRDRDVRVTTHVGLTARALGARRIILCGQRDDGVRNSLQKVVENWGGDFDVVYERDWERVLRLHKGVKVHLTMYGIPLDEVLETIRERAREKDLLVVVGSEKVPGRIYELVHYNVSVTNQPHSEISALAIFLDRLFQGSELGLKFPGAKREITPSPRGKRVLKRNDDATS